jgi:hypothetical protein
VTKVELTRVELDLAKKCLGALRYELEPSIWADLEKNLRPLFILAERHVGDDVIEYCGSDNKVNHG